MPQEMSCVLLLKMYMKYEISDGTGHVQVMYSKCHVSFIWEVCRIHQISDTTENVQEMSCVLVLELYLTCEISNTVRNVIFPCLGNLHEM